MASSLPKQDFLLVLMHGKGTSSGSRGGTVSKTQLQAARLRSAPAEHGLQLWAGLQGRDVEGAHARPVIVPKSLSSGLS